MQEASHAHIVKRAMLTAQAKNEMVLKCLVSVLTNSLPRGLTAADVLPKIPGSEHGIQLKVVHLT